MGLSRKDYHVTLTAEDDHEVYKGVTSLFASMSREDLIERVCELGEDGLDHAIISAREDPQIVSWPFRMLTYVRNADKSSNAS